MGREREPLGHPQIEVIQPGGAQRHPHLSRTGLGRVYLLEGEGVDSRRVGEEPCTHGDEGNQSIVRSRARTCRMPRPRSRSASTNSDPYDHVINHTKYLAYFEAARGVPRRAGLGAAP